ncbi:MAG: hypothetical protein GYB64_20485 [Chloroflexi bacterium]|nr:hypothetical protein [Chloroflexota bacterium]
MAIPTGLIALALLILLAAYIVQPFVARRRRAEARRQRGASIWQQRADLLAERNRIYTAIKELEFDYQTNKVNEAMFTEQRRILVARAVDVLQQLDALPVPSNDPLEDAIDAVREADDPEED